MEGKKRHSEPFYFAGNATGVLLIHGFSGSPSEMRFLGERLATEGWTVLGVLLSGHGSTPEELAKTGWDDWVGDAEKGVDLLRQTCNRVVGVGLSMGGLLTLHVASKGMLDGVITMNTPMLLQDWGARLERFTSKRVQVACSESINQAIRQVSQEIHQITIPALLMQSKQDKTVDPISLHRIEERLTKTQPEVLSFKKSGHVLPLGPERDEVAARVAEFIYRLEGSRCDR